MIDYYVNEIHTCLKNRCWFAALSLTLMLPDICGEAEYPNKHVGERYIRWYDSFVGNDMKQERMHEGQPFLSGEIVYNLRNTFLHPGKVQINPSKVKDTENQIDRFTLILGDGSVLHTMTLTVNMGDVWYRDVNVDVSYLCTIICEAAKWYYDRNREKFEDSVSVILQEWLVDDTSPLDSGSGDGDPIGDGLIEKFRQAGQNIRFHENVTDRLQQSLSNHDLFLKQKELLDQFLENGAITKTQHDRSLHDLQEKMGEKN